MPSAVSCSLMAEYDANSAAACPVASLWVALWGFTSPEVGSEMHTLSSSLTPPLSSLAGFSAGVCCTSEAEVLSLWTSCFFIFLLELKFLKNKNSFGNSLLGIEEVFSRLGRRALFETTRGSVAQGERNLRPFLGRWAEPFGLSREFCPFPSEERNSGLTNPLGGSPDPWPGNFDLIPGLPFFVGLAAPRL